MAKNVTLTVKVDDTQLKDFMKEFNKLSANITKLTTQFNALNRSINATAIATKAWLASMNAINSVGKSILNVVGNITKHFIRWSTIIGSVTALLGMGGGLFGIERLASSIMQRRRQMLGLGGDWGRTRASNIYSQTLLGQPGDVLGSIRRGTAGDMEAMKPLLALGIPFGTKQKPEDILTNILPKIHQILRSAGPGMVLSVAQSFKFGNLGLSPDDLIRLSTEEGLKEIQLRQKRIKEEEDAMRISKEAATAFSDFHLQLLSAGAQLENIFGEKLAVLAQPLSELSNRFVALVRAFMNMPIVERAIKQLAKWMEDFAKDLTEDKIREKLKQFSDEIESWIPFLKDFKQSISDLTEMIKEMLKLKKGADRAVTPPGYVQDFLKGANQAWRDKVLDPFFGGGLGGPQQMPLNRFIGGPYGGNFGGGFGGGNTSGGGTGKQGSLSFPSFSSIGKNLFGGNFGSSINNMLKGGIGGGLLNLSSAGSNRSTASFGGFSGGNTSLASAGGSRSFANFNQGSTSGSFGMASAGGSMRNSMAFAGGSTGGSSFAAIGGSRSTNVTGPSVRMASWSAAANRAGPRGGSLNIGGSSSNLSLAMNRGGRGPGSADNWQSTRTASLTIRNVPGSNVFMSGAGMAV